LISFNHSDRSYRHIRIINELPDLLYKGLVEGETFTFLALPEENRTPPDEQTHAFLSHLEQAKLTDEEYIKAIDSVNEDEENASEKIKQIERDLKNKIRTELNLPIWKEQKSMTNEEIAIKHGLNPSYEMLRPTPENQEKAAQRNCKFIQTLLTTEEMLSKLGGLNSYIRSDIEETGVNTLYVVFSFLQWYESENSSNPCISPILLLQLEIEKKQSRDGYAYSIRATGENPELNLSLSERLKTDFGIELPELTEDEMPEHYMAQIADTIKNGTVPQKEKWCVKRFITIGRFSFARLVMFHDLDEKKWLNGKSISENKIVQHLFAGSEESAEIDYAEDYNVDTSEMEKIAPLLITQADASQHSAVIDVMRGKNLVITGPPGTGKSQTITNIIACALAKGKTVLFLAEKMAALNIVYERLSKANLGPYCMAIHSTKAKKTEVLKSIKGRLSMRFSPNDDRNLSAKLREFTGHKNYITEYIDLINSPFGRQHRTIHEYLWAVQLCQDRIGNLSHILRQIVIPFKQADITEDELMIHKRDLEHIVYLKQQIDRDVYHGHHPWDFVGNTGLSPVQQDTLKQTIINLKEQFEKTRKISDEFSKRFDLLIGQRVRDLDLFLTKTEKLACEPINNLNLHVIAKLGNRNNSEALIAFVKNIKIYKSALEKISISKNVPVTAEKTFQIKNQALAVQELKVEKFTLLNIKQQIQKWKEELKLCKRLLKIGECFGLSQNEDIGKIRLLINVTSCIASIPRESLLFRNENVLNEINSLHLRNAVNVQKDIREYEVNYDLSIVEHPQEIRTYANTLCNAGFFSCLSSQYHRSKKVFLTILKHETEFDASNAAKILLKIADLKEKSQKIKQDSQLQAICGSFFNGIDTDFEELLKINKWAGYVRKHCASENEFARNIRQWIFTADVEELDSIRDIAENDEFAVLKSHCDHNDQSDMTIGKYLNELEKKINKLNEIEMTFLDAAISENVTFVNIMKELPSLDEIYETKVIIENNMCSKTFFGDYYAGVNTDIRKIEQTLQFIEDYLAVPELANNFDVFLNKDFLETWQQFIKNRQLVKTSQEILKSLLLESQEQLSFCLLKRFGVESCEDVLYDDLLSMFAKAVEKTDSLDTYIEFNTRLTEFSLDLKGKLLGVYNREKLDFVSLPSAFEYVIYYSIVSEIYNRNEKLLSLAKGVHLEYTRTQIKKLDEKILQLQQQQLSNMLSKVRPLYGIGNGKKSRWTEAALLNNEINKQRGHISIRNLMERAGLSIQKIKPCFLMSPLTVAQYFDPKKIAFDIVIIDEASQMRPETALGSIARAKQIVVVGDSQQLPPTSFFQHSDTYNDDVEEEKDFAAESIMDMALSSFRPSRILNRHYRSRHESLVAFSNHYFYDDKLILFPSPIKNSDEFGIKLKYVGGCYSAQSNLDEVQTIVKAALNFMQKYPDRTLGIATMNKIQKDLIEMEMDRAFIENQHAHRYRAKWQSSLEPFFVKNLENVQGDERDAIFISTVYGPDKNGIVMQRFGPINSVDGHRRLNVLLTRAKKNIVVFTSLKPEDIKISDNSSRGVKALKDFLTYAYTGVLNIGEETNHEPDSEFEVFVKEKLESIGCEVHSQIGVSGYRIDLGVKHPKYPYGYLIGIECDGATYHSTKSARERDIIRQQVLESLGWRIYRIWSTDWFRNPAQEFEKLKDYIAKLLNNTHKAGIYTPSN
jgi:very-short-patch-repair endonuclease/DNA polymerase III delta prime subunit